MVVTGMPLFVLIRVLSSARLKIDKSPFLHQQNHPCSFFHHNNFIMLFCLALYACFELLSNKEYCSGR